MSHQNKFAKTPYIHTTEYRSVTNFISWRSVIKVIGVLNMSPFIDSFRLFIEVVIIVYKIKYP